MVADQDASWQLLRIHDVDGSYQSLMDNDNTWTNDNNTWMNDIDYTQMNNDDNNTQMNNDNGIC